MPEGQAVMWSPVGAWQGFGALLVPDRDVEPCWVPDMDLELCLEPDMDLEPDRDVESHCCVPQRSLSSRALVSLTRWPAAIVWIFSCFFSFSPVNMCFQYPSQPGSWGLLLLSPVLILFPLTDSLAGAVPCHQLTCPLLPPEGQTPLGWEIKGKFCFSESSSRYWGSSLLSCEVQIMFFIIMDIPSGVHRHKG